MRSLILHVGVDETPDQIIMNAKTKIHNKCWALMSEIVRREESGRNKKKPFKARIRVNTKLVYLGRFNDPLIASEICHKARKQYFGEFA